jgi:hypothetical protein
MEVLKDWALFLLIPYLSILCCKTYAVLKCKLEKPKKVKTHFKPNNSLKKELLQTNQLITMKVIFSFIFSIFALIAAFHSNYPEPTKQRHVYFIFNIVTTTIHTCMMLI